ncbi:MAG: hypothetical protein OD811_01005 [Alphaproteobacteria bacterium]
MKHEMPNFLRVIILQEDGYWIAQCLEYDIVAQSKSPEKLRNAFGLALAAHVAVRLHHNQELFEGVPEAPRKYWELFESAQVKMEAKRPAFSVAEDSPLDIMPFVETRELLDNSLAA